MGCFLLKFKVTVLCIEENEDVDNIIKILSFIKLPYQDIANFSIITEQPIVLSMHAFKPKQREASYHLGVKKINISNIICAVMYLPHVAIIKPYNAIFLRNQTAAIKIPCEC